MSKYFKIGEVSKLKRVSVRALRFYDRVDLLKPFQVDKFTNYRYYSLEQLFQIEMITHLRKLGVSIEDLKFLFAHDDLATWHTYLTQTVQTTVTHIENLRHSLFKTQQFISHIEAIEAIKDKEGVFSLDIEERTVLTRDCTFSPSAEEGIEIFQDIYRELSDMNLTTTYQSGAILERDPRTAKPERKKIFMNYYASGEITSEHAFVIPAGTYWCINHRWTDFAEKRAILIHVLGKHRLTPRLFIEEEAFLDFFGYSKPLATLQILV